MAAFGDHCLACRKPSNDAMLFQVHDLVHSTSSVSPVSSSHWQAPGGEFASVLVFAGPFARCINSSVLWPSVEFPLRCRLRTCNSATLLSL